MLVITSLNQYDIVDTISVILKNSHLYVIVARVAM